MPVLMDFSSSLCEYYASFEYLCYFKQTGELKNLLMLHEQGSKDVILLAGDFTALRDI